MIFGRTRDSLERFRDKETVTADNVLDLFYDLCEDVKEETGTPVDRLPVSSVDGLMRRLPWTGNLIRKIYRASEEEVLSPERRRLLADIDSKVEEVTLEAEQAGDELDRTRTKREELARKKSELEATLKEQENIERACRVLETEADALEQRYVPELRTRLDTIRERVSGDREEKSRLEQEITNARKEHEEASEENRKAKAALEQEIQENAAAKEEADREQQKLMDGLMDHKKKREELETENKALLEQYEEEARELEEKQRIQEEEAKERRLALVQKNQEISREADELLRQEKELEEELARVRGERTAERMEQVKARIGLLQEIRVELDWHYRELLMVCGKGPGEIPEAQVFEAKLDQMEEELVGCAKLYRRILRNLEGVGGAKP